MKADPGELRKGLARFLEVVPAERNNSQSLRRILFDVIWYDFDKSVATAAQAFRDVIRQAASPRKFRGHGLSKDSLYKATRDIHPMTFSQIDAVGRHKKVPMSLVTLFSRVRSEVDEADGHDVREARRILVAMRTAIEHLEGVLTRAEGDIEDAYQTLSHQAFEDFRQAYLKRYDELRGQLF
jgi:hypothetical protein